MAATWLTEVAFPGPIVAAGVFARMAAAVAVGGVPIAVGVGFRVQAAVAVALTLAAVPAAGAVMPATSLDSRPLVLLVLAEAIVGLVLGMAVATVLAAAGWAGGILGSATGLSWSDDFTPEGDPQTAGMARLAWWMGLAGFLAAGGHLHVVAGLVASIEQAEGTAAEWGFLGLPLLKIMAAKTPQKPIVVEILSGRISLADVKMGASRSITGIEAATAAGCTVFHAGTAESPDGPRTAGGRVLAVTGVGADLDAAVARAYAGVAAISFAGAQFRHDIGRTIPEAT